MSFTDVFKKIFGTKADRDLKALKPMLNKVLEAYATIDRLSDDELRERCQGLKDKIQAAIAADEARIAEIRQELEKEIPLSQKEALATEQDKLVKKVDEIIEQVLDEILPDAFAKLDGVHSAAGNGEQPRHDSACHGKEPNSFTGFLRASIDV